jgi:dethiobiotin synthetase
MDKILVAGIGTDVGKTVVSAILTLLVEGDYWKPIQSGAPGDAETVAQWLPRTQVHPPAYSLKAPLSPHHAARLENAVIQPFSLPETTRPLVIEGVGGILVPLATEWLAIDLFSTWPCKWILVSKHYVGSINHTLLTVEALKQRHIPILGIIFNGEPNADSESAILKITQLPMLGRLLPEPQLNMHVFQRYVQLWQPQFGIHLHKCTQQTLQSP